MMIMSWIEYAEWLCVVGGLRPNAAIEKVSKVYHRQYGRPLNDDDQRKFLEFYGTPTWNKVSRA